MAAAQGLSASSPTAPSRRASPSLLLGAFLFVCSAYFVPGASWNPVSRFCLTRAIVETGSFEITPFVASTGDRAQVGERFYTDKSPLPSLLAVPAYALFYAVARWQKRSPAFEAQGTPDRPAQRVRVSPAFRTGLYVCSATTSGIAAALLGMALFEVLRRRTSERAALSGAIATVLGTPIFPYATSFFGHALAAAFVFGAFALIDLADEALSRARLAAAGACLGLAVGSEYLAGAAAVLVASYAVLEARPTERARVVAWLGAGALVPLGVVGLYHYVCFGAPWRTGYAYVTRPLFARGHAQGLLGLTYPTPEALWGLTFGRSRGLFYVAPIAAVGIAALVRGWKERRERWLLLAGAAFVTLLLLNASYYMWHGGWATGPRHLVAALGFVGLGIGLAFSWPRWRVVAFVAALASSWVMIMTTAVALEVPPRRDAIFEYLLPALSEGRVARVSGASNLGLELGLSRRLSVVPLLVWAAFGAWWLVERRAQRDETLEQSPQNTV
jgi:hypothetical protein